jgi:hypothetical protein
MNSKPIQALYRWGNTNTGAKIIVLSIIWLIVSIPFDLYLLVRWGIGPATFWEEIALLLVAVIAIGWLQGLLLLLGIFVSIALILEDF